LTKNKCEFWQTEPDAVQGGECAAVRALQAGANAAMGRLWQPKTHLFLGEYLAAHWRSRIAGRLTFFLQ
jgi:hypothetical protein